MVQPEAWRPSMRAIRALGQLRFGPLVIESHCAAPDGYNSRIGCRTFLNSVHLLASHRVLVHCVSRVP